MPDAWVHIGSVQSANPARREVRVKPVPGYEPEFESMAWLQVHASGGGPIRGRVASVRPHGPGFIVTLVDGVTRDTVRGMKGGAVVVAEAALRPRPRDDEDPAGWIGLQVKAENGLLLGVVRDAILAPANDVITVERPDGSAFLLPVIEQAIAGVDTDQGALVVRDIAPYAVEAHED